MKANGLLQAEDIMLVRDQVKNIRSNWKAESVKERQLQWEHFKSENAEGAEDRASDFCGSFAKSFEMKFQDKYGTINYFTI